MRKKRKVVMAIVPARKRELGLLDPYVEVQLQKSAGSILASNKLARSAPKRVPVRVNGGLGRRGIWSRKTSGSAPIETMSGGRPSPRQSD
jgi:hypothetical protein